MFREPSVDQEDKKTLLSLSVTQQVSTALFLLCKSTHLFKDSWVVVFFKKQVPPLSVCLSAFLPIFLSVHPRQADVLELEEVERSFCLFVSQLFPEESRYASVYSEVRVIQ